MATAEDRRRISAAKGPFYIYLTGSTAHLAQGTTPNRRGEVLGLTTAELDQWISLRDAGVLQFAKYNDPSQRTTDVTDDTNAFMKTFRTFAEPLLNRISVSSALTNADRVVLHLPERDKTPTRRGKIETAPLVGLKGLEGGYMKFRVRTDADASRASMHKLSDLIEVKYMILNVDPTSTPGPNPNPGGEGEGGIPPLTKTTHSHTSKKALFLLELNPDLRSKFILAYVRWANSSNPANSGPWSLPVIGLIA